MATRTMFGLLLLLAAYPVHAAAQQPRSVTAELVAAVETSIGEDPLAALRRTVASREPLPHEDDDAWPPLLLAALWSDTAELAYAAACRVPESWLDLADTRRWLDVVRPHLADGDPRFGWVQWTGMADRTEVARLLAQPPSWGSNLRFFCVDDLHRAMRPEHMPALAALQSCDDPLLRKQAGHTLSVLALYTRQHRAIVATAALAWPGPAAGEVEDQLESTKNPPVPLRTFVLPAARPGWSPLLRATLATCLLGSGVGWGPTPIDTMLLRWADDEAPAHEDIWLARALLDSPSQQGQALALRALRTFGDDAWIQGLLATPEPGWRPELVLAARHDLPALRALAATDSRALATALEVDLDATWTEWCNVAFGSDPAAGLGAIGRLVDAADDAQCGPYRLPIDLPARLRHAVDARGDRLDYARLLALVNGFPAARSPRLLELYAAALRPEHLADCAAAALEVADVDFVGRLRRVARSGTEADRNTALDLLLQLGDPELDAELLAHWQRSGNEEHPPALHELARCGAAPAVRAFLDDALRRAAMPATGRPTRADLAPLTAAAIARGVPTTAAGGWLDTLFGAEPELVRARFDGWRQQVLADDPVAALVDLLQSRPLRTMSFDGLGDVRDPRLLEVLRTARNTPGIDVHTVLTELAVAGDETARNELAAVRASGIYGWLDDASERAWTLRDDLALVPWLIDELETVCCRRNGARSALEHLTEMQLGGEHALHSEREQAAAWWRQVQGHLRWSKIERRYVVAPF